MLDQQTKSELETMFASLDDLDFDGNDNYLEANGHTVTCHINNSDEIIVTNIDGHNMKQIAGEI